MHKRRSSKYVYTSVADASVRRVQGSAAKSVYQASTENVYTPAQQPVQPDIQRYSSSKNAASPSKYVCTRPIHCQKLEGISDDQQEARHLGETSAEGGGPRMLGRDSCSPCSAGCRGTLRSSSVFHETLWSYAPCACILDDGRVRPAAAARRAPWQPPWAPRKQP